METHYKNFLTIFYKFIFDLNRYSPNSTQKALDIYNDLDMAKVIFRTYHLLKDNLLCIQSKNDTLFLQQFIILPEVDLAIIWPNLIKGQKDKIWTYLNILYLEADFLMNPELQQPSQLSQPSQPLLQLQPSQPSQPSESKELIKTESTELVVKSNEPEHLNFNPYIGIGTNDNQEYGVNEMFSALPTLDEDKPSGPGLEAIAKAIGLNKMVNMDELTSQLKNMKKEDIENATNSIKGLLGDNIDEKTSALITDMLTNISDEMKNNEMGKGDPIKNILNIAESVASKMKPKIENDNIDMSQLINSTQIFANQCKDSNGKPMFDGKMNPFALLGQIANSMNQNPNSNPNPTQSNEEQAKQCNDMLKSMGMGNMDITIWILIV